jgi:acyl-homoserine lactone acylase PvdQ
MKPKIKKFLLVLGNLFFLMGISTGLYFKNQAPEGSIEISNITESSVNIYRDSNGNVHIMAQNMSDLLFSQGYMEGDLWKVKLLVNLNVNGICLKMI